MTWNPSLVPGSTVIDLNGLTEGTHPLVVEGGAPLHVDTDVSLGDFRFDGALSYAFDDCRVRGSLSGNVVSACDRCLVPFDRDVSIELEAKVFLDPADESAGVEEIAEGVIRLDPEGSTLDLAVAFRAAVILDEPIKNLCRDECRGLCPVCGVNRNESKCDCDSSRRDPRWDALKDLSTESPKE
ncbi:MAG: hypothetical protein DHS20C21_18790 [Gemmatimonadota bacterium]|nr:MAG: hypothetical protein DHS20C21_18790 [Gemmatimonadota bacterium]